MISVSHKKAHLFNHVNLASALGCLGKINHWEGENIVKFKIA